MVPTGGDLFQLLDSPPRASASRDQEIREYRDTATDHVALKDIKWRIGDKGPGLVRGSGVDFLRRI
jgi:hypothetical protein